MDRRGGIQTLLAEVQLAVDELVRPALLSHGGDITLVGIEDGVLHFRLSGNCRGCPSSWLTAEELVKTPLLERFPALRNAVADTDMDEELVALARSVLSGTFPLN